MNPRQASMERTEYIDKLDTDIDLTPPTRSSCTNILQVSWKKLSVKAKRVGVDSKKEEENKN